MIHEITIHTIVPLLFALPLLAIIIWYSVGRSLNPLQQIAHEVAQRKPNYLEPINTASVPQEAMPLIQALNTLLKRLEKAFENERRFTADASHELRTPLTGIKIQAQVASSEICEQDRQHALERVIQGVDRATHLVEQLLTLARLDPNVDSLPKENVNLNTLILDIVHDIHHIITKQEIILELPNADMNAHIAGDPNIIKILVRNLLDNAIRYAGPTGKVKINIITQTHSIALIIADSGPGIALEYRDWVFERFNRISDNMKTGCGLGLSIVRRIAQLHDATIKLNTSEYKGLEVIVEFRV